MEITLQNVKRKYDRWRSTRANQRSKVPQELLELAGVCVVKYGKGITRRALNLNTKNLNLAMNTYSHQNTNNEQKIFKENINSPAKIEFFEVKLKEDKIETGKPTLNVKKGAYSPPLLYELENKFGVRLRVFSESEQLQKNIFSKFSL